MIEAYFFNGKYRFKGRTSLITTRSDLEAQILHEVWRGVEK